MRTIENSCCPCHQPGTHRREQCFLQRTKRALNIFWVCRVQHKHAQTKREDEQSHKHCERQRVQDDVLDHLNKAGQTFMALEEVDPVDKSGQRRTTE